MILIIGDGKFHYFTDEQKKVCQILHPQPKMNSNHTLKENNNINHFLTITPCSSPDIKQIKNGILTII